MTQPVTIVTDDLKAEEYRVAGAINATPAQFRRALAWAIREVEKEAKEYARSGGAFSRRSTGTLGRSIRSAVVGNDFAMLTVGVKYGMIQDRGGVTKAHFVGPRESNVTRGVSWLGRRYGRKGRINTVTGGVLSWIGPGGKRFFSKGHMVGPATIPATHYSRTAFERARPRVLDILNNAGKDIAGRK